MITKKLNYTRPEAVNLDSDSLFVLCVSTAGGQNEDIGYTEGEGGWGSEE